MADDLIGGAGVREVETSNYLIAAYALSESMVEGQRYTLSVDVEELTHVGSNGKISIFDGGSYCLLDEIPFEGAATYVKTFTYMVKFPDHTNPSNLNLFNTPPKDSK